MRKSNTWSLEEKWKGKESKLLETQWEVSAVSDLRSCVICCCWFTVFIKSKVTAAVFSLSDLQVAQNKQHRTCA